MTWKVPQKIIDINGIKLGGEPGIRPTVLVGSIFYSKHVIVTNEKKGEFDRDEAERLIKVQDEFSQKTGNPCFIDVIGASEDALVKEVEFVSDITEAPILLDGVSPQIRVGALSKLGDLGLMKRIIYNSISLGFKPTELEAIKNHKVEAVIFLANNIRDFTAKGRISLIKETIPRLIDYGIDKVLIDTCVLDIPSLGSACKAIYDVKNEIGYPSGCGAHNAIGTWRGLRTKMGKKATIPSSAVATALSVSAGADYVLYGPIGEAEYVFPATALADTVYARMRIEEGKKPDRTHPMYRIA